MVSFKSIVIGLTLSMVVLVALTAIVVSLNTAYDASPDLLFNKTFNKVGAVLEESKSSQSSVGQPGVSSTDSFDKTTRSGYGTLLRLVKSIPKIMSDILNGVAAVLGINPVIIALLVTTVSFLLIFALLRAVFRTLGDI